MSDLEARLEIVGLVYNDQVKPRQSASQGIPNRVLERCLVSEVERGRVLGRKVVQESVANVGQDLLSPSPKLKLVKRAKKSQ